MNDAQRIALLEDISEAAMQNMMAATTLDELRAVRKAYAVVADGVATQVKGLDVADQAARLMRQVREANDVAFDRIEVAAYDATLRAQDEL